MTQIESTLCFYSAAWNAELQTRSSDENSDARWSFVWYKNLDRSFFRFVAMHVLSVKHVHCSKTEERSVQIFIPYERPSSVSFGQKWKTGTGMQYFTDIIALSSTTVT